MGARIAIKSNTNLSLIIFLLLTNAETQSTYLCDEDDDDDKQNFCQQTNHRGRETTLIHLIILLKPKPKHIPS